MAEQGEPATVLVDGAEAVTPSAASLTTSPKFDGYSDQELQDALLQLAFADRSHMPKLNARRARRAAEIRAELAARR
jgi:hypothetical protein